MDPVVKKTMAIETIKFLGEAKDNFRWEAEKLRDKVEKDLSDEREAIGNLVGLLVDCVAVFLPGMLQLGKLLDAAAMRALKKVAAEDPDFSRVKRLIDIGSKVDLINAVAQEQFKFAAKSIIDSKLAGNDGEHLDVIDTMEDSFSDGIRANIETLTKYLHGLVDISDDDLIKLNLQYAPESHTKTIHGNLLRCNLDAYVKYILPIGKQYSTKGALEMKKLMFVYRNGYSFQDSDNRFLVILGSDWANNVGDRRLRQLHPLPSGLIPLAVEKARRIPGAMMIVEDREIESPSMFEAVFDQPRTPNEFTETIVRIAPNGQYPWFDGKRIDIIPNTKLTEYLAKFYRLSGIKN